ncbi:MAG: hypothetical protein OXE85_02285 [Roseovarius sp.]|nr:hypothetical protein [Roseovarius sp.]
MPDSGQKVHEKTFWQSGQPIAEQQKIKQAGITASLPRTFMPFHQTNAARPFVFRLFASPGFRAGRNQRGLGIK